VNISGSLAMGLITGWFAFRNDSSQLFRLFITTGIAGGFTTFSAFALDTALLWERGQYGIAALYSLSSVVVSIAAVFAGINVVRYL
jgi:CrcB protein